MIYQKRSRWIYKDSKGDLYRFGSLEQAQDYKTSVEGEYREKKPSFKKIIKEANDKIASKSKEDGLPF